MSGAAGVHPRGPPLTDDRLVHRDRNLDDLVAGRGDRLAGQAVAVDADRRRLGDTGDGDPGQLQRRSAAARRTAPSTPPKSAASPAPYGAGVGRGGMEAIGQRI